MVCLTLQPSGMRHRVVW